jgi:hypothetical protein
MTNNEAKPSDGSEAAPFVCESTMVTRATAELNEEILEELSEQDRSIASVLSKQSILRDGDDADA